MGQRFYLFNYATKHLGGYVDIDWFSTEPEFTEEKFYAPGTLDLLDPEDLMMEKLVADPNTVEVRPGETVEAHFYAIGKTGYRRDVSDLVEARSNKKNIAEYESGTVFGKALGTAQIIGAFTDESGTRRTARLNVVVTNEVGIQGTPGEAPRVIATQYFTTDGRSLSAPQRGITLVREQMDNGQWRTRKVLR